ncbi:ImmA/IrrE family metallo-endopeptidase [Paenibacillus polymyxa]|uniref:ImmA/IrrE family metallo-endopeptidase n=1 Tax=Paenibacillus polymyxa TaxID=1406 RepID=UPI00211D9778|nr:ImmA/IrrE family metallo-endopeptidase [Paenibacillus polymyxa]
MFPYYQPTETELLICDLYQTLNINHPHEIDIDLISALWGADIVYYDGRAKSYWEDLGSVIFLNKDDPPEKQRVVFFHELCHIVKHEGHQDVLPGLFVELQETQAYHFMLFASMPYYLLPDPLEMIWSEYIGLLAEEFHVSLEVAAARAEQIIARLDEEYYYHRNDIALTKSKIKIALSVHRFGRKKLSQESEHMLRQLDNQVCSF